MKNLLITKAIIIDPEGNMNVSAKFLAKHPIVVEVSRGGPNNLQTEITISKTKHGY